MNHLVNLKCLLKVSSKWRTDPSTNKVWFPQATWLRVAWTRYRNNIDLAQHCYKHTHTHSWTVCRWKRVQDAALWLDGAGGRVGASRRAGGGAQHAANQYTGMLKYSCRGWRRNTQTHTDNGAGKHTTVRCRRTDTCRTTDDVQNNTGASTNHRQATSTQHTAAVTFWVLYMHNLTAITGKTG